MKCALRAPGEAEIAGSNPAGATIPLAKRHAWRQAGASSAHERPGCIQTGEIYEPPVRR
jgi:hypothetical protein